MTQRFFQFSFLNVLETRTCIPNCGIKRRKMEVKNFLYLWALLLIQSKSISEAGTVGNNGACTTVSDCDETKGLVQCLKPFDSCLMGICSCASDKSYSFTDSKCAAGDFVGQPCTATNIYNAACTNQVVTCNSGTTNVGNVLCRDGKTKLLGEVCNSTASEICFTYLADKYAIPGACDNSVCGCNSGDIWDVTNCRARVDGDMCIRSTECPSFQKCVDGRCGCLPAQKQLSTTIGLVCYFASDFGTGGVGTNCTTVQDCGEGSYCDRCPEHTYTTCRKIPLKSSGTYIAPMMHITLLCVAVQQGFNWFL